MPSKNRSRNGPSAGRPYMPGYEMMFQKGRKFLRWTWAVANLSNAHNYYLSTARSDGRPHTMPVWGVWLHRSFYFSTGRRSRKSRNLSVNPNCVVCPENASKAVILEGKAEEIRDRSSRGRFVAAYKKKYDYDMSETKDPIYQVRARVIFGISENASANPTRWKFAGE